MKFGKLLRNLYKNFPRQVARGKTRIKRDIQREVDLIVRPGRAHGYEEPIGKPHRSRARGHEVYNKSKGVPGFKTKKHHSFLQRVSVNRATTVAGATAGTFAAFKYGNQMDKNTEEVKKATRVKKYNAIRIERGIENPSKEGKKATRPKRGIGKPWTTRTPYSRFPTESPFKTRLENVVKDSFKRKKNK